MRRVLPKSLLLVALMLCIPLIIHMTILQGHVTAALFILLTVFILLLTRSWKRLISLGILAFIGVGLLTTLGIPDQIQLFAIPVLINSGLAVFFGLSLLPDRTPIITKYAILIRGEIDTRVAVYTRRVTQLWTIFFVALAVESLLLALYAPIETWSLFANFLNYIFAALLFTAEYYFRIHHLDHLEHMSLPRFIHNLSKVHISDLSKQP